MGTPEDRLAALEAAFANEQARHLQAETALQARVQELTVQLTATADATASADRNSILDKKVWGKPSRFDGDRHKWQEFAVVMRSYCGMLEPRLLEIMEIAEREPGSISNAAAQQSDQELSKRLHFMLTQLVSGPAFDICVNAGLGEGVEAWRKLTAEYEPRVKSKTAGSLLSLLKYPVEPTTGSFEAFDKMCSVHERITGSPLSDELKMGIVLANISDVDIRNHLVMHSTRVDTYGKVRAEVRDVIMAREALNGPAAMNVDALKGAGKGKKGKKGKDAPHPAGGGKGGAAPDLSSKKCFYCDKVGHIKKDCRKRQADLKAAAQAGRPFLDKNKKKVAAVAEEADVSVNSVMLAPVASEEETHFVFALTPSPSALRWGVFVLLLTCNCVPSSSIKLTYNSTFKPVETPCCIEPSREYLSERVVCPLTDRNLLVCATTGRPDALLMIDGGSAATVCPPGHAPHVPTVLGSNSSLVGAGEGHGVEVFGHKLVHYRTASGVPIAMNYTVANVRFPIISVFKLTRGRGEAHHTCSGSYVVFPNGHREALQEMGSTFWLPAWFDKDAIGKTVAPVQATGSSSSAPAGGNTALPGQEGTEPILAEDHDMLTGEHEAYVKPRTRRPPVLPSEEEQQAHEATHLPFRDWCVPCIEGKAPDWPHKTVDRSDHQIAETQMDYFFVNRKGDADLLTVQNFVDVGSGAICCCVADKGPNLFQVQVVSAFLDWTGRTEILLRTDSENAATAMAKAIKIYRVNEQTQLEASPRYSSSSLGVCERLNGVVEGQLRTLRKASEDALNIPIKIEDTSVVCWLVRHAGWLLTRFLRKRDGLTPYMKLKGKPYSGEIAVLFEQVLFKIPGQRWTSWTTAGRRPPG